LRHLLFDLDGTLTDPAPGITACIRHAAAALGSSVEGDLKRFIGPSLRESFRELLATDDAERVEAAVQLYRERFARVGLFENTVYDGVPDALVAARAMQFRLLVVTSKPKVYADRIVDHFGLREHFAAVYGPELTGERSDKAALLEFVLRTERLAPSQACMVGDREHDIRGAKANDIPAIGVAWGYGTLQELREAGADLIVDSIAALLPAAERLIQRAVGTGVA